MIEVQVHFFSTIRARIGERNIVVELPAGSRVQELKRELTARYPEAAAAIAYMNAAVDQVFSDDDTELSDGCLVAFFPYVTGG
ncbi:MAG: MoaD/ThiS family protein [Anaerolineales bacterium]